MKKKLALLLAALLCLAAFAACTEKEPTEVAPSTPEANQGGEPSQPAEGEGEFVPTVLTDKLVVGLDDTFAPMGFRDPEGTLVGFDIDLATAVGEELGVEIVFQPIDWDAKELELEARTIDCIWNGMSQTPARMESMTLSQPYLNNRIIIMTNADVELTSIEQLAEYQVGTQAGSAALEVVQGDEIYETIKDNLFEYATYDECILDMQAGRIQVMVVDEVLGQYKNNNLESKLTVAPVDFGDDLYVIGFRKGDTELCAQVEDAIKAIVASGKGAEISEKWFGENLLLELE